MQNKIYKVFAVILSISMALHPLDVNAKNSELSEAVRSAAKIMEDVFDIQYEQLFAGVEDIIEAESADYDLSIESFYELGDMYASLDITGLMAAYAILQDEGKADGFANLQFVNITYTKETIIEKEPVKIDTYKEIENGIFVKDGSRYLTQDSNINVYEQIDGADTYAYVGTKHLVLNNKTTTYLAFDYTCLSPLDVLTIAGLESKADELYSRQFSIAMADTSQELMQSIRLLLPTEISSEKAVELLSQMNERQALIAQTALSLQGQVPYEWGGKSTKAGYDTSWWLFDENMKQNGLDCSGFVQWVFRTAGYPQDVWNKLLSTSSILQNCTFISKDELQAGDLGLLNYGDGINHVGIYLGDNYFVHCASSAGSVVVNEFPFKVFVRIDEFDTATIKAPDIEDISSGYDYTDKDIEALAKYYQLTMPWDGINAWCMAGQEMIDKAIDEDLSVENIIVDEYGDILNTVSKMDEEMKVAEMVLSGKLKIQAD